MEQLSAWQIAQAVDGNVISGDQNAVITNVSIDSRKVDDRTLFIPLKGEKADGHDFIEKAISQGAPVILTHRDAKAPDSVCMIRVQDTLKALGQLAKFYVQFVKVKVVAVTGSVGKTSTKEMIASVLSQQYRVVKTQGNYNNHIGLPLTIFGLTKEDEIAVLEMGMNHFGEIDYLADIAQPDVAVITNIGVSHIENLGSREGILKSKMEINSHLKKDGKLILNADNDMLRTVVLQVKDHVMTYSMEQTDGDFRAENVTSTGEGVLFDAIIEGKSYPVKVPALGDYHVYNALCALCVGSCFSMNIDAMIQGIAAYQNTGMRMKVQKVKDYTMIVDCYNAAPDSMKAALRVLKTFPNPRRVAILGDMLEMGFYAKTAHYEVGKAVAENAIDVLITIGTLAEEIANGAKASGFLAEHVYCFKNNIDCLRQIDTLLKAGDAVLLKASRGMALEEILQYLER